MSALSAAQGVSGPFSARRVRDCQALLTVGRPILPGLGPKQSRSLFISFHANAPLAAGAVYRPQRDRAARQLRYRPLCRKGLWDPEGSAGSVRRTGSAELTLATWVRSAAYGSRQSVCIGRIDFRQQGGLSFACGSRSICLLGEGWPLLSPPRRRSTVVRRN